jgi:hypothetical protein
LRLILYITEEFCDAGEGFQKVAGLDEIMFFMVNLGSSVNFRIMVRPFRCIRAVCKFQTLDGSEVNAGQDVAVV